MYRTLLLLLLAVSLMSKNFAQPTYGKENCASLFNRWIDDLNEMKKDIGAQFNPILLQNFYLWTQLAKKDIKEAPFKILQPAITDDPFYRTIILLLKAQRDELFELTIGKNGVSYAQLYEGIEKEDAATRQLLQAMSFLLRINRFEVGISKLEQNNDSSYLPIPVLEHKKYGKFKMDSFYKFLLDYVEYGNVQPMDMECIYFYEANREKISAITGVLAPVDDKIEDYLRFFSGELLYAYSRYNELIGSTYGYSVITFSGIRYDPLHTNYLLPRIFRSKLSLLIEHIETIAKNCAATPVSDLGKLTFNSVFEPIPQTESGDIPLNGYVQKKEDGRIVVIQKNADGSFFRESASLFDVSVTPRKWKAYVALNAYVDVIPGKYFVFSQYPAKDSALVELPAGGTRIVRMPAKGTMSAKLLDARTGNILNVESIRIELLRQNRENSYLLDTIFFDLHNGKYKPREMNAGLYRAGLRMPNGYFPPFIYAEEAVEVKEGTNSLVTITGFGELALSALSGTGQLKKEIRADIYTYEKNTKNGEYSFLSYMMSGDTLHMRPGKYRLWLKYPFSITREVEVRKGQVKELIIDNLGGLVVNRSREGYNSIEITDDKSQKTIAIKNNTTIDVETDRTYTVRIVGVGNIKSKIFTNVEVRPGQVTTVNW